MKCIPTRPRVANNTKSVAGKGRWEWGGGLGGAVFTCVLIRAPEMRTNRPVLKTALPFILIEPFLALQGTEEGWGLGGGHASFGSTVRKTPALPVDYPSLFRGSAGS